MESEEVRTHLSMRFISWRPSPFRKRSRLELSIRQEQSESNKFSIISCSSAVLGLCLLNTCQAKTTESTEPWENVCSSANTQQFRKPACHDNPTAEGTKAYQTKFSLVSVEKWGFLIHRYWINYQFMQKTKTFNWPLGPREVESSKEADVFKTNLLWNITQVQRTP